MKSLKKLAVVLAAALAGSFLSVMPANASVPVVSVSVNGVPVTTAASPLSPAPVLVPADNTVNETDTVRFDLTGLATGTIVSVSAVNAFVVPALATAAAPVSAYSGATTWSTNLGTGTSATFFAYTRSTSTSSVTVSFSGNAFTYYIKGIAGPAYNIAFAPAATANTASSAKVIARVTDVFGNPVAGAIPAVAAVNVAVGAVLGTDAKGEVEVPLTYPLLPGKSAVSLSIAAADVVGLPASVKSVVAFVDVVDLAALLAAEKAGRAIDKDLADKALAAAKAEAAAELKAAADKAAIELAAEKAKAADAAAKAAAELKAATDKAAADIKAAADKAAVADKAIADLTAQVAALTKAVADIKKAYNAMAKKYKFKTIK